MSFTNIYHKINIFYIYSNQTVLENQQPELSLGRHTLDIVSVDVSSDTKLMWKVTPMAFNVNSLHCVAGESSLCCDVKG